MIEELIKDLTAAIREHTAAVKEQTAARVTVSCGGSLLTLDTPEYQPSALSEALTKGEPIPEVAEPVEPKKGTRQKKTAEKAEETSAVEAPAEEAPATPEPEPESTEPETPVVDESLTKTAEAIDDDLIEKITATVREKLSAKGADTMAIKTKWNAVRDSYGVSKISDLKGDTAKLLEAYEKAKEL